MLTRSPTRPPISLITILRSAICPLRTSWTFSLTQVYIRPCCWSKLLSIERTFAGTITRAPTIRSSSGGTIAVVAPTDWATPNKDIRRMTVVSQYDLRTRFMLPPLEGSGLARLQTAQALETASGLDAFPHARQCSKDRSKKGARLPAFASRRKQSMLDSKNSLNRRGPSGSSRRRCLNYRYNSAPSEARKG